MLLFICNRLAKDAKGTAGAARLYQLRFMMTISWLAGRLAT